MRNSHPLASITHAASPMWSECVWVPTSVRTSSTEAPASFRAALNDARWLGWPAEPQSTSRRSPASQYALTCGTSGQGSGSRSCHTPGASSKARARSGGTCQLWGGGPTIGLERGPQRLAHRVRVVPRAEPHDPAVAVEVEDVDGVELDRLPVLEPAREVDLDRDGRAGLDDPRGVVVVLRVTGERGAEVVRHLRRPAPRRRPGRDQHAVRGEERPDVVVAL